MGTIWLSICSAHREVISDCPRCQSGDWVDEDELAADKELYEKDYLSWYLKANGFPLKNVD